MSRPLFSKQSVLHVSAWTIACGLAVGSFAFLNFDVHREAYEASILQIAFLLSSLVVLLVVIMYHLGTRSVNPGSLAPWITTSIFGGAFVSWTIFLHLMNKFGAPGFYSPSPTLSPSAQVSDMSTYRMYVLVGMAANTYVLTFLASNIAFSGPAGWSD